MFVIPLPGDKVETNGGVKHTVLSFAAYKKQPAIYVEAESASTESVLFADVKTINGTPVTLTPGKVFRVNSLVKRKIQLPQTNDKIVVGDLELNVKTLKMREHGKLTDGLVVVCEKPDTGEHITVRIAGIERITRANGDKDFSRQSFHTLYKDYLGHKTA